MAKNKIRMQVRLESTESTYVYWTQKSKRNTKDPLQLRKYDPILRRHVMFKEKK